MFQCIRESIENCSAMSDEIWFRNHQIDRLFGPRYLAQSERLGDVFSRGGIKALDLEVTRQLDSDGVLPVYVYFLKEPAQFSVANLRSVAHVLVKLGYQEMALDILGDVACRTEAAPDLKAVQDLWHRCENKQLKRHAGPRAPTAPRRTNSVLVLESGLGRWAEEHHAQFSRAWTSLGYEITQVRVPQRKPESASNASNCIPAADRTVDHYQDGEEQINQLIRSASPGSIQVISGGTVAYMVLATARQAGIPTLWIRPTYIPREFLRRNRCRLSSDPEFYLREYARLRVLDRECARVASQVFVPPRIADKEVRHDIDPEHPQQAPNTLTDHFVTHALNNFMASSYAKNKKTRVKNLDRFCVSLEQASTWAGWIRENYDDRIEESFERGKQDADDLISNGWVYEEFEPIHISAATDWKNVAAENRSWNFTLHSWGFLDSAVRKYLSTGDEEYLYWSVSVATSWAKQVLAARKPFFMEWYDMALSLRSPRLAGLLHLAVRAGVDIATLQPLFELALAHQDAHEAGESFNAKSNHGFYAARGQILLARWLACMPGMTWLRDQGEERMELMIAQQFLPDGGHAEHSPGYHRMLLRSFEQAYKQGVITSSAVRARLDRASEALGWYVQPNGKLLPFGDSLPLNMLRSDSITLSDYTNFLVTDGRRGEPNPHELFVLPDAGFAAVRTPQPRSSGQLKNTTYLAMAAGFHSQAHKHCDDLSIVWWHQGFEILVDAGRYGYGPQLPKGSLLRKEGFFYATPERQFIESVPAHNTVAVDGKNHDRRRVPYGSALKHAEKRDGFFVLEASVNHTEWKHSRRVILGTGKDPGLRVIDCLTAFDDEEHRYDLHFNFNGDLSVGRESPDCLTIANMDHQLASVGWEGSEGELFVVRAQMSPLMGWRSVRDRQLIPTWAVRRSGVFRGETEVVTRFDIKKSKYAQ